MLTRLAGLKRLDRSRRLRNVASLCVSGLWVAILNGRVKILRVALGVGSRVVAETRRLAAAVDLPVLDTGLATGDHASIATFADHPAVADVSPVSANIELHVVCSSQGPAACPDAVGNRDSLRAGSDGEPVAESNSVLVAALGVCELQGAAGRCTRSGKSPTDIDPRTGPLGGRVGGGQCGQASEKSSRGKGGFDVFHRKSRVFGLGRLGSQRHRCRCTNPCGTRRKTP